MRRRGPPSSVGDDMLVLVQCNIQGSTLRSFFACINYVHKKERGGSEKIGVSGRQRDRGRARAGRGGPSKAGRGKGRGPFIHWQQLCSHFSRHNMNSDRSSCILLALQTSLAAAIAMRWREDQEE